MPDETIVEIEMVGATMRMTQTHPLWPEMSARIAEVKGRAADLSQPFREFQDTWFDNETIVFAAGGIPSWPALSPAYAVRKQKTHPGMPIMRRTDRLYDSLTSMTPDSVYEVSPQQLVMGTTVEYSLFHQLGGAQLPQRVHVQLLEQTWQELNGAVFEFIVNPFERG